MVGSYNDDMTYSYQGSVYVFTGSGAVWSQEAKFTASDGAYDDYFGYIVSISSSWVCSMQPPCREKAHFLSQIAVGAYGGESMYTFSGSGASWTQVDKMTSYSGYRVAMRAQPNGSMTVSSLGLTPIRLEIYSLVRVS